MKIGTLEIKKAYFGILELTATNAYVGEIPLIIQSGIPNDEIWYTSTDDNIVTPYSSSALPTIVSNTYNSGKGIIKFASNITFIQSNAFKYCSKLTSMMIPNSVTSIQSSAFYDCTGLTSVKIPNSIISIGSSAFHTCSNLSSIIIPNITDIKNSAFYGCRNLSSIIIPDSVQKIEYQAFGYCSRLTSISYNGTIAQWNSITKESEWNLDVKATVVHCTDGDVSI